LREGLRDKNIALIVWAILGTMDSYGIDLPIFLDALSWGDPECIQNAKIRYERSTLMNSAELPGILRRWWKPPRPVRSRNRRPKGARSAMEHFALECTQVTLDEELQGLAGYLQSPVGEDINQGGVTHRYIIQSDNCGH
jgi:hypothetical protein